MSTSHANLVDDLLDRLHQARRPAMAFVSGTPVYALTALARSLNAPQAAFLQQQAINAARTLDRKTPIEEELISGTDHALLDRMVEHGYIERRPRLRTSGVWEEDAVSAAYAFWGEGGEVSLATDRKGDVPIFFTKGHESEKARAYRRWMVLLHEAAHCQFERIVSPLRPAQHALSTPVVAALNRWVVGTTVSDPKMRTTLNECFADTYGLMMLLRASGFDPDAIQTAHNVIARRREHRQWYESAWAEPAGAQGYGLIDHVSEHAITRMLADLPTWRDLPAAQMQDKALEYASDGFLDIVLSNDMTPQGVVPSRARRQTLCALDPRGMRFESLLHLFAADLSQTPLRSEALENHPAGTAIKQVYESAKQDLNYEWSCKRLNKSMGAGDPAWKMGDDTMYFFITHQAHCDCREMLAFDPAVQQALAEDRKLLREAFGVGSSMAERLAARRATATQEVPTPRPSM